MAANIVASFEKVSFEQFRAAWSKQMNGHYNYDEKRIRQIYDSIEIPSRATTGSAGYDFKIPVDIHINFNSSLTIPSGIRCKFYDESWVLKLYPRSSQGFKYGIRLANSCGIIDADYYGADNEGHIMIKLVNESVLNKDKPFDIAANTGFAQGIFSPYGIIDNDNATAVRHNGMGSTDKK